MTISFDISCGNPSPLGNSKCNDGINFAVTSPAEKISLCLFIDNALHEIPLDPAKNRTGDIWHIWVKQTPGCLYGYTVNDSALLLDPYATATFSTTQWGGDKSYQPMSVTADENSFDWEGDKPPNLPKTDLVIYEMHVRSFTQDPSSRVTNRGSYLGIIEKIPHLVDLGINAVELMPIHEFNENEYDKINPLTGERLYQYWGYSTVNFFSPMQRFAVHPEPTAPIQEFKTLVKELHKHGIEVYLDVVYNHTAEGNEQGPVLSYKGLDEKAYYLFSENQHCNYSGCGNSLNSNHPITQQLILDSLRYWVTEMHVDGFRFDLASVLTRDQNGAPLDQAPILEAIANDPVLQKVKLIAEPWDAGGLYQVGHFSHDSQWSEWNDKYRDVVRDFIKGTGDKRAFAGALSGSQGVFNEPLKSLNYITAHDGFTLKDLVSYNYKHNLANGEDNRDGLNNNISWNCGAEGDTRVKAVYLLRQRQMRNFVMALMLSQGIPMLLMGDEYCHSRKGNNNTWCQDNRLNWFLWDKLEENQEFYRFCKKMLEFRKKHPLLRRDQYLTENDIIWHGRILNEPDWDNTSDKYVAYTLIDHENGEDLFVAFNVNHKAITIKLPDNSEERQWCWIANSSSPSPYDFRESDQETPIANSDYKILPHTAIILKLRQKQMKF